MLSTESPISISTTFQPPLSTAATRAMDACPSLRRCSSTVALATSLSPLQVPAGPTLMEFFTPSRADQWHPSLTVLGYVARTAITDSASSPIFWIGRRCWPTSWLLGLLDLHARSIFIDTPNPAAALWAIDQSLRTGGTRVIVADGSRLDMSATRRIQLACESSHAHCLLARPNYERDVLTAAAMRWHVEPAVSDNDLPAWQMTLLRDKRSSLFAGVDAPAWIIRTMRNTAMQYGPSRDKTDFDFAACALHLSSELVDRTGTAALRPRRSSFA